MIFQDPMTSLNPVTTVGDQLIEAIQWHNGVSYSEAHARAVELLRPGAHPRCRATAERFSASDVGRC